MATVTVTEADLMWLFYAADGEQRLTERNDTLAATPVRLAHCGISIGNGELAVTAQCKAFGFLPLPIKAVTEAAVTQQSIDPAVKELYPSRWTKLPLEKLTGLVGIGSDGLQFSLPRDTYPLLERIDALSIEGGHLVARCRLGAYLIEELFEDKRSTSEMACYTPRAESLAIAAAKEAIDRGDNAYTGAAFDEILARAEADPAYLMTLRADVPGAARGDMRPARVYPVVLVMLGCDGTPLTLYVNGDFKLAYAMLPVREGLTTEENYRAFMAYDKVPLITKDSRKHAFLRHKRAGAAAPARFASRFFAIVPALAVFRYPARRNP